LQTIEQIEAVCAAVDKPVNVLARSDLSLAAVFDAGAQRVSVGGALTWVAASAMVKAAIMIRDDGDLSALGARLPLEEWLQDASGAGRA
jgi:2-methylisocitrate lyase-like PEP mutase family enzyme